MLKIEHLETIIAIIDEGTVTKAARKLDCEQSNISIRLKQIEAILGIELFCRTKQGLIPSHDLLENVDKIQKRLVDINDLMQSMKAYKSK